MNKKIVGMFVCMLLISTTGISVSFAGNIVTRSIDNAMPLGHETPLTRDIKPIRNTNDFYALPVDTQVSSAPEEETHLSCAKDGDGNPFVIYDKKYDISTSNLITQFSSDKGASWPEDLIVEWNMEDIIAINPDISMLSDNIFAFGTFETAGQEPEVDMLIYPDIADPETWQITYFDRTGTSSYVYETAAATKGENTVAIACLLDYDTGEEYFENTILINWNCNRGEDTWPGVYWLNTQGPYSHLTGDAGEKIFFCAEQEQTDGRYSIKAYYCNVTETTVYSDWDSGSVAGSRGNCTNPDISVSGNRAYCVYMDDKNGNQDVYVATTTSGSYWNKYVIVEAPDDELYPVISANGDEAVCTFIKNNNLYVTETKDAGKTWSDPVKVNDDTGSVISEYGSIDIIDAYGFWASNREGNNDIFFEEVGQFAEVVIDEISGGMGIKVALSNVGNADAEEVPWSITIDGKLVFSGADTSGTISIPAGGSATINSGFVLAIGKITITVTVDSKTLTFSGFALGPFLLNVS
jgi:hypothetical protein